MVCRNYFAHWLCSSYIILPHPFWRASFEYQCSCVKLVGSYNHFDHTIQVTKHIMQIFPDSMGVFLVQVLFYLNEGFSPMEFQCQLSFSCELAPGLPLWAFNQFVLAAQLITEWFATRLFEFFRALHFTTSAAVTAGVSYLMPFLRCTLSSLFAAFGTHMRAGTSHPQSSYMPALIELWLLPATWFWTNYVIVTISFFIICTSKPRSIKSNPISWIYFRLADVC